MINQLRVTDLGVIADVELTLGEGMTAITGETGAGKTLIIEALGLLLGGRAVSEMVRAGAEASRVEGQFFHQEEELVITRFVPTTGRSRAQVNGVLIPQTALAELGADLVDLYGQHEHQSLLRVGEQRRSLDLYAGVDLSRLQHLRSQLRDCEAELVELGGDDALRERELELIRHELQEIDDLGIESETELEHLEEELSTLSNVVALREAVGVAYAALESGDEGGASQQLSRAIGAVSQHQMLGALHSRLDALSADLEELARDLRSAMDAFEEDPRRLEELNERRHRLARVVKKHGETFGDLRRAHEVLSERLTVLERSEERRVEITVQMRRLGELIAEEERRIGDQRRACAGSLGEEITDHLHELGLARARIEIALSPVGLGDDLQFLFAANQGEPLQSLARVASGGELARAMLALRLVLSSGPSTLVFDEVDAGIGGEAALAVGRALQSLAERHQVVVITHLAQVASYADHHFVVDKIEQGDRTISTVAPVSGEERVAELARMLSGHPESPVARQHAHELLVSAVRDGLRR